MATRKTGKKRKSSPAQIAAQKRFAAMAEERAKAARGRNSTVIKARTIKKVVVSKARNGRKRNPFDTSQKFIPLSDSELSAKYSEAKTEFKGTEKAKRAALSAFNAMDATVTKAWESGRPAQSLLDSYKAARAHFEETSTHAARLDDWIARAAEELKKRRTKRNPRQRNKNGTVSKLRATHQLFTGRARTKTTEMHAPTGTPKRLVKLGRVIKLQTRTVTIKPSHRNPASTVWLCADTKGKLHLCSTNPRLIDGPKRDFGQVVEIEYATAKPHLDYPQTTRFFHKMGEEGGRKPSLIADGQGGLKLVGGDYRITREGLEN
jgi:hypothetical protein